MLTKELHIIKCSDEKALDEIIYQCTGLFYKMYNKAELMSDKEFQQEQLKGHIDKSMFDFCVAAVKTKHNQFDTTKKKKENQIKEITKQLEKGKFETKKEKRQKYNLINKLAFLNKTKDKQICFGGKALLREITKLSQNQQFDKKAIDSLKKQIKKKNVSDINLKKEELSVLELKFQRQKKLLKEKKKLFTKNRQLGIYLIGRALEFGNRKVNFKLDENKITLKINSKLHIDLEFIPQRSEKEYNLLLKLQELALDKSIPLTVRITSKKVDISYDNELINGYDFKKTEYKREKSKVDTEEEKKAIFKIFKEEQNARKKIYKIGNRYISIDLNPHYIGLVIFDAKDNKIHKEIYRETIVLKKLSQKLNLPSDNSKQIKQNNKRKHEIKQVWKYIFELAKHYKVYNFVMEDLDFKSDKVTEDKGKSFNRQTKNIWHRTLTTQLITKYCENIGLNKIEVNPCYSSFIGNMIYDYSDPVSASLEIGRRGINKYTKGFSIYPSVSLINQEKLNYLLDENEDINGLNWVQIYNKISLSRYRNPIVGLKDENLHSHKSKIIRLKC